MPRSARPGRGAALRGLAGRRVRVVVVGVSGAPPSQIRLPRRSPNPPQSSVVSLTLCTLHTCNAFFALAGMPLTPEEARETSSLDSATSGAGPGSQHDGPLRDGTKGQEPALLRDKLVPLWNDSVEWIATHRSEARLTSAVVCAGVRVCVLLGEARAVAIGMCSGWEGRRWGAIPSTQRVRKTLHALASGGHGAPCRSWTPGSCGGGRARRDSPPSYLPCRQRGSPAPVGVHPRLGEAHRPASAAGQGNGAPCPPHPCRPHARQGFWRRARNAGGAFPRPASAVGMVAAVSRGPEGSGVPIHACSLPGRCMLRRATGGHQ